MIITDKEKKKLANLSAPERVKELKKLKEEYEKNRKRKNT